MKIIQIPFCFYPEPVGGTEIYVDALSRHLQALGVNVLIAAPGQENQSYFHHPLPVRRFAMCHELADLRELYGEGDELAAKEFSNILDEEKPDLVHLHAFTSGASVRIVRAAKQRGIPVVFTYHTPTVSCQRGTLMRGGTQVCDGKLDLHTCARCTLQGLGLNPISANLVGSLSPLVGQLAGMISLSGGFWTALRMTELIRYRHAAFDTLMSEADSIVAVSNWVKDVLVRNHVPPAKITVIRQGLCHAQSFTQAEWREDNSKDVSETILKIAFLGRLDPIKGVDILIKALLSDSQLPVQLDIYGVSQGGISNTYAKQLHHLAQKDPRIHFKCPVPANEVVKILADYDLLAVPSQWLETGPMVVLEAFAAGIPVIGSHLGGIAERVEHKVNGLLVEPNSIEAWYRELQRLCRDRDLRLRLEAGIHPPDTMQIVAEKMMTLYRHVRS
ncbi:glycosyltransferase [Coleofasciculus sp. G2-EDA-02]|uniref:glycosyltransferase n=1 Tax=Coleofasciculus sp. G2-EDA-02 TaxID=3069529 RepID=UPI0032F1CED3